MIKYILLSILLALNLCSCKKKEPKTYFVDRKEQAEKAWQISYANKIKWLKKCKEEDSKFYNEIVLTCKKGKWIVSGVI